MLLCKVATPARYLYSFSILFACLLARDDSTDLLSARVSNIVIFCLRRTNPTKIIKDAIIKNWPFIFKTPELIIWYSLDVLWYIHVWEYCCTPNIYHCFELRC